MKIKPTPQIVDLGPGRKALSVSANEKHACAILDDGNLKCWGFNNYGQLGIGSQTLQNSPQLVDLGLGRTAVSVSLGRFHTCAILDGGTLKCWGHNYEGQLGIGSTSGIFVGLALPQTVNLGTGKTAVTVSLGEEHTCANLDDGSLKCWGRNDYGQLGVGSTIGQTTPQLVDLGVGRTALSVILGSFHTCAILDDGMMKCWGYHGSGRLGVGSANTNQETPQSVNLGVGRTAIYAGLGSEHTCANLDDGSLKCWGVNNYGQLGIGSTTNQETPQLVDLGLGRTALSVSLGEEHTCAILDDGSLKCWGQNTYGQFNSDLTRVRNPKEIGIKSSVNVKQSSVGNDYTCAILYDDSLKCWGP